MMDDDSQSEAGSGSSGRMPAAVFEASRKGLNALAVSPDGSMLATATRDGCVRIHDLTTGAVLTAFRVHSSAPLPYDISLLSPLSRKGGC